MQIMKVVVPSLKEAFIQEMENLILSGELKIGDKLPTERELVEKTGVSLSVVGAGLSELESKGFVEIRARQGVFVTDYIRKGTISTLNAIMRYNSKLNNREVRSMIKTRIVFEQLMVREIAEHGDMDAIKKLSKYLERIEATDEPQEITDAILDLFHELAVQSDNILLPLIYNSFRAPMTGIYLRYFDKNGTGGAFNLTKTLFDFICEKKVDEACDFIEKYLLLVIEGDTAIY